MRVQVVIVSMIYSEGIVYELCGVAEYTFTTVYALEVTSCTVPSS